MRKIRIYTLILTCLSLGVMACFPTLLQSPLREKQQQAHRRLVTVWMYGDTLGASGWVRGAAAVYQKENRGVSVWVRTVTAADLALLEEDYRHTAPDVLLFTAGADVPMVYAENVRPLCLAGYALVRRTQTQITPAPTSLSGGR